MIYQTCAIDARTSDRLHDIYVHSNKDRTPRTAPTRFICGDSSKYLSYEKEQEKNKMCLGLAIRTRDVNRFRI